MDKVLDRLTKVLNRKSCIENISGRIKKGDFISVALLDIDFFTNINDKMGWETGDQILVNIADYLKQVKDITVGRYGGDEFVMIFASNNEKTVMETINTIHKGFRIQRFVPKGSIYEKVPMTVSIGVAFTSMNINRSLLLLKSAEIALFTAKKRGRNRVELAADDKILIMNHNAAVTTVAGGGLKGVCQDGAKAFKAKIAEPYGVDLNNKGELYIVDRGNHRIIKINHQGRIVTVEGLKYDGYQRDDNHARGSRLSKPSGIAVGAGGEIYIADTGNHCIRKIDKNGVVTTIAGCCSDGYSGDGGPAISARLSRPGGVAADQFGNIYTNDYGNNVVRMITKEGVIYTIAGSGKYGYEGDGKHANHASMDRPYGLAVTPDGSKVFIADYGNHCIRQVDMKSKLITTLCGNGEAGYAGDEEDSSKSRLNEPYWVSVYDNKYLFIADAGNHCIRVVNLLSRRIETIAGGRKAGYRDSAALSDADFNTPAGMVYDSRLQVLYVADYANNAIRRISLSGLLE